MMKVCVLTANLGSFDKPVNPVNQTVYYKFHRFTDKDFPPIAGLTPRLQYRIPKTHGWQLVPDYDIYVWLDGSVSLTRTDSLRWLISQLGDNDLAIFTHPDRKSAREETDYIESKKDHPYIKSRYENGLHQEQMKEIEQVSNYPDDTLYASTAFAYRPTVNVREMMKEWLYTSVRYFTCDQIALPYLCWEYALNVKEIEMNPFSNPYVKIVSRHR